MKPETMQSHSHCIAQSTWPRSAGTLGVSFRRDAGGGDADNAGDKGGVHLTFPKDDSVLNFYKTASYDH